MSQTAKTGLDYTAVEAVMRIRGVWEPEVIFEQIRLLERGYLWAAAENPLDELLTHG